MTRTEILLVIDSPMEFFPQRIVGDIHHALHDKSWYKQLTSFEVGARGYQNEAQAIADEMYSPSASGDTSPATVEKLMERNEELGRQVQDRTEAFFRVWNECERMRKEINGGV